jgi:soluble lytic murein transglycosylase
VLVVRHRFLIRLKAVLFLLVLVAVVFGVWWWFYWWPEHRFDEEIRQAAARYQLDPALVKAVVWRESRFDPSARGRAGEIGLMQIRETAAREWVDAEKGSQFQLDHLAHPATNAMAGAYYLGKMLRRYARTDDPVPYALADYNAGRSNVLRWLKGSGATNHTAFLAQMDFPGTRRYIESVRERRERYRHEFESR